MKQISLRNEATELIRGTYTPVDFQNYSVQEDIVKYAFGQYPENTELGKIEAKVKLLNLFYSTGMQATVKMAQHILSLKIDKKLEKGDLSIVEEIAKLPLENDKIRNNYSFATKYCANHYPDKYPIYDSLVATLFCNLFANQNLSPYKYTSRKTSEKNSFTKSEFANKLRDYRFYVEVYRAFMKEYDLDGLTYREVDSYLWTAVKLEEKDFTVEKLGK